MISNKPESTTISTVERRLEELKDIPARDPLRAASGRTRFLREAAQYRQAVSVGKEVRQRRWMFPMRKEKLSMNALVSLILAFSLLLGGGATVAAAQDDLPNQSLYQLKLWTENATLGMNGDPQKQATQLMTLAQTRVQEIAALTDMGIVPPDQVRDRLEQHLRQTLQIAANVDAATCEQILLQLRDRLQTQDRIVQQLQTQVNTQTEPLLTQTRLMLQTHLRLVDVGLADPQGFRYVLQNQMQYGQEEEIAPEPNQQGEPGFHQNGPEEPPAVGPGDGDGNGSGPGNEAPGEPNPDKSRDGNGGSSSGNEAPGEPNHDGPKDGSGSGSGSDGGNGPGGGGKN